MSTPLQMAKAECANFHKGGRCLGIPVECLTSECPTIAAPLDRCKLAEPKATCRYFEGAVLPLVQYYPRYARAAERYRKRLPKAAPRPGAIAGMWECDCGNPMRKGRRMCDVCARKKRLAAKRRWKAKQSTVAVDS